MDSSEDLADQLGSGGGIAKSSSDTRTDAPADGEALALATERALTLRQHLVPASLAGIAVASVLWVATRGRVDPVSSGVWYGASVLLALGRLALFRRLWAPVSGEQTKRWLPAFALSTLASGAVWGASAWVFYVPGSETDQLLLAFLLGGLSSGAAVSLGCYLPAFLAWIGPALVPLTCRMAMEGDSTHWAMASTLGFFVVAMSLVAQGTERTFRRNVRLRFENQSLLETLLAARQELEAVNAALDARVSERTRALEEAERRRELVEQERKHAEKLEAIGRLTGGVAHDFNNLLSVLLTALPELRERVPENAEVLELINGAEQAARRGARLTESLLSFSRAQKLNPASVDLNAALNEMRDGLLGSAVGKRVTLRLALEPSLWQVSVDPDRLGTALLNLAVNAKDAMPRGGELLIEGKNERLTSEAALGDGDYVALTFEDDGEGMTQQVQERAIEPFFTTKAVGKGSGLGLSMVYGFVRQSGGDLRIASASGNGTRVTLLLPRAASSAVSVKTLSEPAGPTPRGNAERILLVEDEPELRRVVVRSLTSLGYQVLQATNAERALAMLDAGAVPVHALVTDVVMPGRLDGFELIEEVRRRHPELPVLLVSGYPEAHGSRGASSPAGADVAFLRKPFRPAELGRLLHQVLTAARRC